MKKEIVIVTDNKYRKNEFTGLAYSYLRAFKKKGIECEQVSLNINPYLYFALRKYYPQKLSHYIRLKQKPIINYLKNTDKKIVFVIKGYYLLPETIHEIKTLNKFVFTFNPDDPFSSLLGSSNNSIKKSIPLYDCCFIWSKKIIKPIQDAGCNNVFYLPFGADTDLLNTEKYNLRKNNYNWLCDFSFAGNGDPKRIEFLNNLATLLKDKYQKKVYGGRWKGLEGYTLNDEAIGEEFMGAIINSKINLNILRVQNKNSNNMRTFEIPAVGGFMLHEYSDEAVEFFVPGVEAEYFRSAEECADKIRYYLKNEAFRLKIAKAGHEKIFAAKHLYTDRVDEIWEKVTFIMQNLK